MKLFLIRSETIHSERRCSLGIAKSARKSAVFLTKQLAVLQDSSVE